MNRMESPSGWYPTMTSVPCMAKRYGEDMSGLYCRSAGDRVAFPTAGSGRRRLHQITHDPDVHGEQVAAAGRGEDDLSVADSDRDERVFGGRPGRTLRAQDRLGIAGDPPAARPV